jgi:thioredoxin reductase (NADPH)
MSTIDTRHEQMFPKLTPREIDRLRRFGEIRHYSAGEALFVTGDVAPGMYVLIKGSVRVIRRDPLGHTAPIVEQGPGEFVAEVGQLSGQPAFVDVRAIDDVEALLIPPENVRALMIAEPELGERIMRALILRRIVAIETGAGGPVLIGSEFSPDVIRLQSFLARNAYPHQLLDPEKDEDARKLVEQYAPNSADLPLAVCPKGTILKNPSEAELARALGMVPIDERDQTYDVAVVGAGPAVPLDRGLCRLRRSLGHRPRRARLRRTGRGERADRKLSRLSCRHFWPGAHRPGLRPGAEIWCPDDDTQRRGAPRPRGNADCAPSR